MKKNVILIGDKIITTKTAECGEKKIGTIICNHPDNDAIFGIKFDFEDALFHKLQYEKDSDGILNKNQGLWLEAKDFKVIALPDENKRQFNHLMMKGYIRTLELNPKEIERSKSIIESCKNSIKEKEKYIEEHKKEIEKHKKSIEILEKQPNHEAENYFKWYEKLKKHPDINDIMIEKDHIIIKTNDLIYHHRDDTVADFNLGAFYIFIPENLSLEIKAINYKRQYNRGKLFHSCVKEGGIICMGDNVRKDINKYRKENQILFLIYLLINFLKEPNYEGPYLEAEKIRCMQKVTYKPKDIFDYLDYHKVSDNESWDEKQFYKDMIKNYEDDIKRFTEKNIHEDKINSLGSYIRAYKERL